MMSVPERQHSIPDTGAETTKPDSRLMFPPSPTAQGVVDGSWWPRTRDPAVELPALIAAVTDRLGKVDRIALNADAWDTRPQRITTSGQPVVRLDWSGDWDAHTIRVTGGDFLASGSARDPARHPDDPGPDLPSDRRSPE
jgi:hypothetical protein